MKTYILLLILFSVSILNVRASQSEFKNEGPRLTITFEIGKPLTCEGWGICKMDFDVNWAQVGGYVEGGSNSGSGGGGGGSWIFAIERKSLARLKPEYLAKFEGQTSINFEHTFVLPDNVRQALGSPKELVLQGNSTYPMEYQNGYYLIRIPL